MQTLIRNSWLALAMLTAVANAQQGISPGDQLAAQVPATVESVASEDVVPAAELEAALQELESVHAENYNTLAKLTESVPASARPAIQQAMERSRNGWQRARQNRQRSLAKRQARMEARQGKGGKPQWAGQGGRQSYRSSDQGEEAGRGRRSFGQSQTRQQDFGQGQSGQPQVGQQRTAERPQAERAFQSTQGSPQQFGGNGKGRGKSRR